MKRAHVVGAGLGGLAAAVALVRAGYAVEVSEAAAQAGGRCRSYHDAQLGLTIDNGNHLVLSGNRAVAAYLDEIGASDRLSGPEAAVFDFADLRSGARWRIRPNPGPLAWWVAAPGRRVPGTGIADYAALGPLLWAGRERRVEDVVRPEGALWERLIEPLLIAALNTPTATASAALAGAIVRQTLARGGRAYRPRIAAPTLAAAFVDPALAYLARGGGKVRLGRRLRAVVQDGGRVTGLAFADATTAVAADEPVVLAVPPWVAAALLPGLEAPDAHHAIVNAHYAVAPPPGLPAILGVIGGQTQWLFAHADRLSVTISAADALCEAPREALAAALWAEVARLGRIAGPMPRWQIVREKRATFAATPEQDRKRPASATKLRNLWLAGDWVQTGLPATIEGALQSGANAARLAVARTARGGEGL